MVGHRFLRAALPILALLGSLVLLGPSVASMAPSKPLTLSAGDTLTVNCSTTLSGTIGAQTAELVCAAAPTPTAIPPAPTAVPTPSTPTGACGESMEMWHPPVVNGCATGHEHGDAPPAWITEAGYHAGFHGHFNTSAAENTAKHQAMKAFLARFNNVDIYFRIHAASNPLDRSARYHSYEVFARDPVGGVSHWQGWYNTGDPVSARIPRRSGSEPAQRPIILVVDQISWNQGIRCEQWYSAPGQPAWSWDFGWTICNTTTLFNPDENATASDQSTWVRAPDNSLGVTRRLEAAFYSTAGSASPNRGNPPKNVTFWTNQFGDYKAGENACGGPVTRFGTSYEEVCLDQFIAGTMPYVQFPGNAAQRQFPAQGVTIPN
jgi:hypothetical protein